MAHSMSHDALLAATRRPTWLPPPPEGTLDVQGAPNAATRVTLVSVAVGQPFEDSLRRLWDESSALFNRSVLWRGRAEVLDDPLARLYREVFLRLDAEATRRARGGKHPFRPFCAAFKPLAIWRALADGNDGDYVLWADASKYHINQSIARPASLWEAIDVLRGRRARMWPPMAEADSCGHRGWHGNGTSWPRLRRRDCVHRSGSWKSSEWYRQRERANAWRRDVRSAFGVVHCSSTDCDRHRYTWNRRKCAINSETVEAFRELIEGGHSEAGLNAFSVRPQLLNTNLLLENTPAARLFVWDWLHMALVKPKGFCASHVQDQAAFTLLAHNRSIPLVNTCVYQVAKGYERCVRATKSLNQFLVSLAESRYETLLPSEFESAARGFLITNESRYLVEWNGGRC